jgi:hypothetical protein
MDTNELATGVNSSDPASMEEVAAWEEIAAGRYMPRRIRGSCRGRVLG